MANLDDDPDAAAARLEEALERIARSAVPPRSALPAGGAAVNENRADEPPVGEIAARLDSLIGRLRGALATRPG